MLQAYMNPKAIDGILRVVEAQKKYLHLYGVNIIHEPRNAQVCITHGADPTYLPGVPPIVTGKHVGLKH